MNNLIKNELSKILHKKALYIILILVIGFIFLNCILDKVFSNIDTLIGPNEASLQQSIDKLDKNNPQDKDTYYSLSADLETLKLSKKYSKDSWQKYVVKNQAKEVIEPMLRSEGTEDYKLNKIRYDEFVQKLDNGDWKIFASEELKYVNSEIEIFDAMSKDDQLDHSDYIAGLKDQRKILEARLENNIPYGNTTADNIFNSYVGSASALREFDKKEKIGQLSYNDKIEKQLEEASYKVYNYAIDKKIDNRYELTFINEQSALASTADQYLIQSHMQYSLFIIIAIVIVAGTIVSEESNKGTIKLLLVKPFKRTKILLSKFIACLIIYVIVSIIIALLQFIIGGIFFGFNNYVGNIVIYNFSAGKIQEINSVAFLIISWISILPEHLLLLTLAFTVSTVFNSSALAIAISLLTSMASGIINQLAFSFKKAEFLRFFVTPNWELTGRLFGKLPRIEGMTIPFSICICLLYFIVLAALSIHVFKRRDIKNV